jgi:uncharacterized phiE125 gp8 family phage protein
VQSLSWEPADSLPVTLGLVKAQLRIDHDDLDELLADAHIPAAMEWAEGEMHRSIIPRTHYWVLPDFPRGMDQSLRLPRGKTQSVASVKYTRGGSVITLTGPSSGSPAGSDYREDLTPDTGGILLPAVGQSWPSVDIEAAQPVLVTFVAGWTTIPADVKGAIIRHVGDQLDVTSIHDLPQGYNAWHEAAKSAAISAWRLFRW